MAANRVARAALQKLQSLSLAGVTQLPKRKPKPAPATAPPAPKPTPVKEPPGPQPARMKAEGPPADRAAALETIRRSVAACRKCAELVANRTQTVFGVGNLHPRLVLLGEAPGADEDRQGEPFVGAAGQLLNDIITKGLQMRREDVYILNVLKCRPPGNRTPEAEEAASCRPFLDAQLAVLQPEFICCLGAVASQNLLGTAESIGRLRGRLHEYQGAKVVCTYHPAYLLRNPAAKRDTWEDLKLLMREMGLPRPS